MVLVSWIERTLLNQITNNIGMAFTNGNGQRRRVIVLTCEQRRTTLHQFLHPSQITLNTCCEHRPHVCSGRDDRSEEHTSELQSRGLISYAVFCLKKKTHP